MNAKVSRSPIKFPFQIKTRKPSPLQTVAPASTRQSKLVCQIAEDAQTILDVQRFRAKVFGEAYQTEFTDGIDHDPFDQYSIHVLVRDVDTQQIVACTRVITPAAKHALGHYYSETEFKLNDYLHDKQDVYEIGRTCVDLDYRGGKVLAVLWMGMLPLVFNQLKAQYLIGTVSVNLSANPQKIIATEGYIQAKARTKKLKSLAPFRLDDYLSAQDAMFSDVWLNEPTAKQIKKQNKQQAKQDAKGLKKSSQAKRIDQPVYDKKQVPSLIKKYRRCGALFSEQGYFDQDFNCVDYFVSIEVNKRLMLKLSMVCKLIELNNVKNRLKKAA